MTNIAPETARAPVGADPIARRLLAGFLAGASGVASLLLILALILVSGGLWELVRDIASGMRGDLPLGTTLWQSMAENFGRIPFYFWSARWGAATLGALGVLLALAERGAERLGPPWSRTLSFVATFGIMGAIVSALQYANRENLIIWMVDQPLLLNQRQSILVSDPAMLLIGLLVALGTAYVVWALWSWWYERWTRWLGIARHAPPTEEPAPQSADDALAYQARLHRLKREPLDSAPATASTTPAQLARASSRRWLIGLAAATLGLVAALQFYHAVGAEITDGDLWVTAETPRVVARLQFDRAPQRMTITNNMGGGRADITLSNEQASEPAGRIEGMLLANRASDYQIASVDLQGMAPGRYILEAWLREGSGGRLHYVVLQGGGTAAQVAAWVVGLAAGAWLTLAALQVIEVLGRRGRNA